jgi:predicted phosphoribosyltransferase
MPLGSEVVILEDREDAGRRLAGLLGSYRGTDALILAVPRGGVVVGYQVAKALDLPLDVVVPRKLGAPGEPELAIGAVAPWGDDEGIVDEATLHYLGVSEEYIRRETQAQLAEIGRRLREYRGTTEPPDVQDKTVILLDDGIATGYTIEAAVRTLRRLGPSKIVLAVPVAAIEAAERLSELVDEFHVLATPSPFLAVGQWYVRFDQTTDEEVIALLGKRRSEQRA